MSENLRLTLGIETSCDETSVAVVEDGRRILANVVSSQVDAHRRYGGVVPEIASRKHLELILPVTDDALDQAGVTREDINLVAVTAGPGLVGSLVVGLSVAKALAFALRRPLVGVNHLEGHLYANFLERPEPGFPLLCLVVSGGHTDLVVMRGHGEMKAIGRTRDDAAGEAFDKVARALGLGYPGGPLVDELAFRGRPDAVPLPRAYLEEGTYDFSFSGLKTAVVNYLARAGKRPGAEAAGEGVAPDSVTLADVAASFQEAVADVLVERTIRAAWELEIPRLAMAGGVAANSNLRRRMAAAAAKNGFTLVCPKPALCTDNAAMIACAGYYRARAGQRDGMDLNAFANLPWET